MELQTNSLGLRGSEPEVPKPPRVFRIVCLGDEQVLGAEVPVEDTFCMRLQQLLQARTHLKVEVVNAGVPEYCPLLSYLQLRHGLAALQPDLIILTFEMGDVADDYRFRRHTILSDMEVPVACPHEDLVNRPTTFTGETPSPFLLIRRLQKLSGSLMNEQTAPGDDDDITLPVGRYAWLREKTPEWDQYIEDAFDPLGQINQLSQSLYARFVVVAMPAPCQVSAKAGSSELRRKYGIPASTLMKNPEPIRKLSTFLESRQIPLLSPLERFQSQTQPEELFALESTELSKSGHALYAEELARFVLDQVPGIWNTAAPPSHPLE